MNEWGIWTKYPSGKFWWFGLAAGDRFVPFRFSEAEAIERAARSSSEARIVPVEEYQVAWNKQIWKELYETNGC
jgi:hypothetical protein